MEIQLTGTEVHALRETLENVILEMERDIAAPGGTETREELERKKDALRSIRDKLPPGLIEVA